jgi:hypothetical protein
MTAGTTNTASMMNLVWDKLLPALQPKPLRADPETLEKLKDTLAELTLHPQQGTASPGGAVQMSGKSFLFPTNDQKIESVALEFGRENNPATLIIRCDGVEQRIVCGHDDWIKGRMTFVSDILRQPVAQPVAASGAWVTDGVYQVKLAFYETPFCITITLHFSGDQLLYDTEYNVVRRGLQTLPQLVGHVE